VNSLFKTFKELRKEVSKLQTKGSFAQNVSIVFSGNIVNFGLQVILTPIISRIFGPEAYGQYAYYSLVITNIAFFASLAFPSVYVIPKSRLEYFALGKFVICSVLGLTGISVIAFTIFNESSWLQGVEIHFLTVPLIVLVIVFQSLNGVLNTWNVRSKLFKKNTVGATSGTFAAKSSTILIGLYLTSSGSGLLFGDFIKSITEFILQTSRKVKLLFFRFFISSNWHDVKSAFRKNIKVPKYIYTAQIINKVAADIPIWVIGLVYNQVFLGYYVFAVSIMSIPKNLVSLSIRPVFIQKTTELYHKDSSLVGPFLERIIIFTFILTFIPISILFVWAPLIFEIVFGSDWIIAGEVATVMGFYYLLNTIGESLSGIRRVIELEKRLFFINLIGVFMRSFPLILLLMEIDFFIFVYFYAIVNSLFTIINFGDLFYTTMSKKKATLLSIFVTVLVILGSLFAYIVAIN
jgi:O-antigen/teichoic acid export membrane protein